MQNRSDPVELTIASSSQSPDFNDHPDLHRPDITSLCAMIESTVFSPQNPQFRKHIEGFEKSYAKYLKYTRIFISRPDQVPGYRRIILLGSNFADTCRSDTIGMIAVTSDGRLVIKEITDRGFKNTISVSSVLDVLGNSGRIKDKDLFFRNNILDNIFDYNRNLDKPEIGLNSISIIRPALSLLITTIARGSQDIHIKRIANKIMQELCDQEQNHFKLMRLALRDALDVDVLRTFRSTGLASIDQVRWLTGGDDVPTEIITARQQAVKAYPLLAELFWQGYTFRDSDRKDLRSFPCIMHNAIDARKPLAPAIATFFKVEKYRIKRLQGLTSQYSGADSKDPLPCIMEILSLPEGTVPKTRAQFRQLDILREFGKSVFDENLVDTITRLSRDGNPLRFIDRIKQTSGHNVNDAIDFLARKLYVPAILNKIGMITGHYGIAHNDLDVIVYTEATNKIHSDFKPGDLLDWSERYHRNIARYESQLDTIMTEQVWTGLFDVLDFGNGYIARELTSARALRIQGKMEDHCVGGYMSRVFAGEGPDRQFTLIFSIEKNDKILATTEIECTQTLETEQDSKNPYLRLCIIQNEARSNTKPCKDAVRIANLIVKQLESVDLDTCQTYLDGLNHASLEYERDSNIDFHIRLCGFDPFDRTMIKRAWKELSPGLPRGIRNDGLRKFIDRAPVNVDLLEQEIRLFSPEQHHTGPAHTGPACPC